MNRFNDFPCYVDQAYNATKTLLKSAIESFKQLPPYQQQQMIQELMQEEAIKSMLAEMQRYIG